MCGRYSLVLSTEEIIEVFGADSDTSGAGQGPRFNIAPTQDCLVVVAAPDGRRVGLMEWGMVPSDAPDRRGDGRRINARSETLLERPAFRESFLLRRCLVPADGYYEWEAVGKAKQPHWIHSPDRGCLALAGIWSMWVAPNGLRHPTFSILTRNAHPDLKWLHHRAPVILGHDVWGEWMARETSAETLGDLMEDAPHPELTSHPVSTAVNRSGTEGPDCIVAVNPKPNPAPEQRSFL